jgi:hypothetical protein
MRKSTLLVATAFAILIFSFAIGQQPQVVASPQEVWEYKVLKVEAEPNTSQSKRETERAGLIELPESKLNRLGLEGYELISLVVEFETVWPNFGDREFVTGIQPNVRPSAIVMTFKRKTTKKLLNERIATDVANEFKEAERRLEALGGTRPRSAQSSPNESGTTSPASISPSKPVSPELLAENAKFWQLNEKVALLDGVIPNELESKEFPVVGAVGPLSRIEPGARILGIELSEEEGMIDVRNWDEIRTLLKRATSKKIRVKWMNSGGGSTYNFAIEIGGPSKQG